MSNLAVAITGFVVGDDLEVRRTITGLTSAMTSAWITVKRYEGQADLDAKLQKQITTVDVPGTGQIEVAGGVGVDGDLRFDLSQANTTALGLATWVYDIQVKLADGKVYTVEKGTITLTGDVTTATS